MPVRNDPVKQAVVDAVKRSLHGSFFPKAGAQNLQFNLQDVIGANVVNITVKDHGLRYFEVTIKEKF